MEFVLALIGGVLTIVNTIVGIALTNLFKTHAQIQSTLAQNQGDIRINAVHLDHLVSTLREHTDSDRISFEQVREQQRELHLDNRKLMEETNRAVHELERRNVSPSRKFVPNSQEDR